MREREQLSMIIAEIFGTSSESIIKPFILYLNKYKAFPFIFSEEKRFRTTVQATCLLSLSRARLLDKAQERTLQETIISMKDSWHHSETDFAGGLGRHQKKDDDKSAWCAVETPSVWSTAYVVWALLSTGYQNETHILPAIDWLVSQQDEQTGGFAFQKYRDCTPTVYLTSLAIKALNVALSNQTLLEKRQNFDNTLKHAIDHGLNFILSCSREMNGTTVFVQDPEVEEPENKIDWISTIWAYRTLTQNNHPSAPNPQLLFSLLQKELEDENKLRSFWRNNAFLIESHTKYGEQKIFKYFMPSLLIPLLNLGLDPSDLLCTYFLRELKQEFYEKGWPHDFRSSDICTFTTALALQTIYTWASRMSVTEMQKLISENEQIGKINNIDRDEITDSVSYKEKYVILKQRCFSLLAFIPALILLIVVPWYNWFSSKNLMFIMAAISVVVLCLLSIRLFFGPTRWTTIFNIITLLGSVAGIISLFLVL